MTTPPERTKSAPETDAVMAVGSETGLAGLITRDLVIACLRYVVVGGISLVAYVGLSAAFREIGLHYLLAGALGFVLATGLNYFLSARFVFAAGSKSEESKVALVYLVSLIGLGVNLGALWFFVSSVGLPVLYASIFSAGVAFAWNFLTRYFWIFAK